MIKENAIRVSVIILGLAYATAYYRLPILQGLEEGIFVILSFAILAPLTAILFQIHKKPYMLVIILLVFGVSAAAVVDAALDEISRNLLPFEIAYLCLIYAPGVFGGLFVAWRIDKVVHNKSLKSGTPQSGAP